VQNLIQEIISWAENRNLVNNEDIENQILSLLSQSSQLSDALNEPTRLCKIIGNCYVEFIIICRMRNITLYECLQMTNVITDKRIKEPQYAVNLIFQQVGKLYQEINADQDIKATIGYMIIYITALSKVMNISIKDCLKHTFDDVKNIKSIKFNGIFLDENDEAYQHALGILRARKKKELH
jgi:hypothetical protein